MTDEEPNDGGSAFPAMLPGGNYCTPGLSKREWMVGQILSNPAICHSELMQHQAARTAVEVADLVLELLNQEPQIALGIGGGK